VGKYFTELLVGFIAMQVNADHKSILTIVYILVSSHTSGLHKLL
jgi:hypothetical protein